MKVFSIKKIETLKQKSISSENLIPKAQLKGIKGGFIVEENAEGI